MGVVGAGYFGLFHLEKYLNMEEVELAGVVDIDSSRLREIDKKYVVQTFSHHSDLFGKVQSVSVAVPTPFHHTIARDFFLHGIDVLLEKPIASTLEEADDLVALAESSGLILQIGHLERFNGALLAAENMILHPSLIECQRLAPFLGRGAEVDVVLDLMVHDIDIVLNLANSGIKRLEANGSSTLTPYFDIARARIEFENGCIANLTASRVSKEKKRHMRIFQADGTWMIDYLSQKASYSKKMDPSGKGSLSERAPEELPVRKTDPLEMEIRSFLQSVRDRKEPKVSGRKGRQVLEVALSIIQNMKANLHSEA